MLHTLLKKVDSVYPFTEVSAHCDIPCGIYDTTPAQIHALSVLRYCKQIADLGDMEADKAKFVRLINEKEVSAELAKHEIRIIWGDYFKGELLDKYPDIHKLAHDVMLAGSGAKQHITVEAGQKLVDAVNKFAETFWDSKGVETYRAVCPYEPKVDTIYPKLN